MTTTQITRLALWGGLALFLIGVLSCGAAFVIEANDPNVNFTLRSQTKVAFHLSLFFWTTGIVVAVAGAILKAFK